MSRGVNKVILVGNIGGDPEVRYTQDGKPVATLSLATSEAWKDKNSGERQERTEWHRIVCFSRLGEIASEYIRKGSKLYVEGSLKTRKWQDQQGQDRYTTEIIASNLQMLDSRPGSGYSNNQPSQQNQSQSQNSSNQTEQQPENQNQFEGLDDDIPF